MSFRDKVRAFVDNHIVQNVIIVLIVLNALSMGLETFPGWEKLIGHTTTVALDWAFVVIFLIEILLRLYAYGPSFFKNGWNNFDFIIVAFSLVPGNGVFSCFPVVHVLRIFRTARLFGRIENLRIIVSAMLKALPNLGWLLSFSQWVRKYT